MTQHDVVHCLLYHHLATKDFTQRGEINSKVAFLFFFKIEDISGYPLRTKIRGYRTSIYVSETLHIKIMTLRKTFQHIVK